MHLKNRKQFVGYLWLFVVTTCGSSATNNNNNDAGNKSLLKSVLQNNNLNQQVLTAFHNSNNGGESESGRFSVADLQKKFNENYKKVLSDSSGNLDLLNDSAEVDDDGLSLDGKKSGLKFDDFVSQKELSDDKISSNGNESSFINVFRVPKSKTKKTLSSKHSSIKNEPVINDFNSELLFSIGNDENLTNYNSYFEAFTSMFDHNKWNINTFEHDISKPCLKDVQIYLNDLSLSKDWAVKVSDASGRYRGLFFFENTFWLGNKQFCYDINYEKKPQLYFFVFKLLIKLEPVIHKLQTKYLDVGQCLPKSCSLQDVTIIMKRDPASIVLQQTITVNGNNTKANEVSIIQTRAVPGNYSIWRDHKFYIFGIFILALLCLIISATLYEWKLISQGLRLHDNEQTAIAPEAVDRHNENNNNNNSNDKYDMNCINNNNHEGECDTNKNLQDGLKELDISSKLLLCFALGSNSKVLLSAKKSKEDSLTCIHGLRFFTLLWTILVHTYLQMFAIGENRFTRNISERSFIYQIVGNATYSVDTFFFISGLLVVLLFLKTEKGRGKNLDEEEREDRRQDNNKHSSADGFWLNSLCRTLLLVLYRFLRLTPAYFFIMVLTELSMKVTYNQSVFTPGLTDHINCNKYFYRNILYVNNFYPLKEICMMWSWYLSNDFQFYIVSIGLLLLSTRYLKVSVMSTILLLIISWIVTICVSLHFEYMHKVADPFESFDYLYKMPYQRFGPYAMGMIAGYILFRVKVPPKVPFAINIVLWSISLFTLFIIIFGVEDGQLNVIVTSLYVSFGHTAWGFALIWITLSCCWGLAGPINSLLSYNGFFPLSRLTYCTYLIHPTVMLITSFQSEGPMHLRHGLIFTAFLGNAVISFILAFIVSLSIEAPVIRLLKVLFKK